MEDISFKPSIDQPGLRNLKATLSGSQRVKESDFGLRKALPLTEARQAALERLGPAVVAAMAGVAASSPEPA